MRNKWTPEQGEEIQGFIVEHKLYFKMAFIAKFEGAYVCKYLGHYISVDRIRQNKNYQVEL